MSKHIYSNDLEYITSTFDEVSDEDIKNSYKDCYISNLKTDYPKLEGDKIVEHSDEQIRAIKYQRYIKGTYTLATNEIIENEQIKAIETDEYEYIEDGVLKYRTEDKRAFLLRELKTREEKEKEKPFEYKGYLQPNRANEDQTSLFKVKNRILEKGKTSFKTWKMFDKDWNEYYVEITLQDIENIEDLMELQTTEVMQKASELRIKIRDASDQELKTMAIEEMWK